MTLPQAIKRGDATTDGKQRGWGMSQSVAGGREQTEPYARTREAGLPDSSPDEGDIVTRVARPRGETRILTSRAGRGYR